MLEVLKIDASTTMVSTGKGYIGKGGQWSKRLSFIIQQPDAQWYESRRDKYFILYIFFSLSFLVLISKMYKYVKSDQSSIHGVSIFIKRPGPAKMMLDIALSPLDSVKINRSKYTMRFKSYEHFH